MRCSVFIATSADGYIATTDGGVEWLDRAGNSKADMGTHSDMGFVKYIASVDCIIMGRKCMEKISSFNLSPEDWPYGDTRIFVLSKTLSKPPENLKAHVEMYGGEIPALINDLENQGYQHAYVDGGMTITSFLNLRLINEMTITRAPIILGEGLSLTSKTNQTITLEDSEAVVYPNDFIQIKNKVNYE